VKQYRVKANAPLSTTALDDDMLTPTRREVRVRVRVNPSSCNSIAVVWVMQIGGGNKGMMDSCTHKNK